MPETKPSQTPCAKHHRVHGPEDVCVEIVASAELPTRFGSFRIVGFTNTVDGHEHVALVHGDVNGARSVPVRLHSECLTGDALGSLKCDCGSQLNRALAYLGEQARGILLYMRQEGRGIGLLNKIRAYALQDQGYDTVQANEALGFPYDARDYRLAAEMLKLLGVRSIELLTNNPDKVRSLREHNISVERRVPLRIEENPYNREYLRTKRDKLGHDV
ncbi:MAG: GTP cyclohydrolase II [Candidatus Kerfeldbacteria bacterium]|nr:GTP cyclohydrolase II [Candidatus Kerfeldbacteria bacterium]